MYTKQPPKMLIINILDILRKYTDEDKPRKYIINPYQIAAVNVRYYLICSYDKYDAVLNYRLDRISNIEIPDTPQKQIEKVKGIKNGFNLTKHLAEHIYMFSGESDVVTFKLKKYLVL